MGGVTEFKLETISCMTSFIYMKFFGGKLGGKLMYRMRIANAVRRGLALYCLSLTLARACAAKGYCSRSVGRSVG